MCVCLCCFADELFSFLFPLEKPDWVQPSSQHVNPLRASPDGLWEAAGPCSKPLQLLQTRTDREQPHHPTPPRSVTQMSISPPVEQENTHSPSADSSENRRWRNVGLERTSAQTQRGNQWIITSPWLGWGEKGECLKEIGPPPEKLLFSGVAVENAPAETANYPTLVPQVPAP